MRSYRVSVSHTGATPSATSTRNLKTSSQPSVSRIKYTVHPVIFVQSLMPVCLQLKVIYGLCVEGFR